jgi:hypothetical protein
VSRRERLPVRTHGRRAFKTWLVAGAAALMAGGSQIVTALPAAANTGVTLYTSASSVNTTTPCTNSGDPCTLATVITEANGDTGDTINLSDGSYTAPTTGFTPVTTDQTWQGESESGTILSGVSGMTAAIVTITSGTVAMNDLTISGGTNNTGFGGGIANADTLTVNESVISDNEVGNPTGATDGGGIYSTGTLTLTQDSFSGNTASNHSGAFGGAVHNNGGELTATGDTFFDNTASAVGLVCGGAICSSGTAVVSHDIFTDNTASSSSVSAGGAIESDYVHPLTATDDTFTGNSALVGGAISNDGSGAMTVARDTFAENTAATGGGIYVPQGVATVTDSTFFDNGAIGNGGGIGGATEVTLSVVGSTFSNNAAADFGNSLESGDGTISVADDVFSGAASCDRGTGTWTDDGYNVASDSSCFSVTPATGDDNAGSGLGTELGPLAGNGGPTQTIELLAGNPALGIIPNNSTVTITQADGTSYTPCPVTTDQRGISSPPGASCDSGAVQSSFPTTVNGSSTSATISYGATATFAETEGLPPAATGTVTFNSTGPIATLCTFTYPTDTSCTTVPNAGTYTGIVATFTDTDGTYSDASADNVLALTVLHVVASTTTTLQLASGSTEFGQEHFETFSTKVTGHSGDGYPRGTVTVYNGTSVLCSSSLPIGTGDAATAKCSLTNDQLDAATYPDIHARFSPGSPSSSNTNYIYTLSASSIKHFTVNPASTATTLTLTSPVTFGAESSANFHITVKATGATPSGSILILSNSTILCSTTLGSGGTGTCTLTAKELAAGTYSVTAIYTPSNENFLPSSSIPHTLVVHH